MAFFTTSDGKRLHYDDTGSGPPLLCLAGLTRTGRDFGFLAPHISDLRMNHDGLSGPGSIGIRSRLCEL